VPDHRTGVGVEVVILAAGVGHVDAGRSDDPRALIAAVDVRLPDQVPGLLGNREDVAAATGAARVDEAVTGARWVGELRLSGQGHAPIRGVPVEASYAVSTPLLLSAKTRPPSYTIPDTLLIPPS
jgi:hypothetical protein